MKVHMRRGLLTLFFSFLIFANMQAKALEIENYKLDTDDIISVNIYDEPELSLKEVRVSSQGTITMPLIGQVVVKGFNLREIEQKIIKMYKGDYLKNPDVSIAIKEYRQFYVNGEVNKPGGYNYREGMTVQRAITLAGGFTNRAKRDDVVITENSQEKQRKVKLSFKIQPGDVITVEESFF
ncbi:polysaccharide export protein [Alteromonas sp. NFXS44]|uniref:polysaccharide biosynthesis/export family protein n=1 Tax=Alteromonas sp. NFXS44 TaxID=2818435 RepID=UPI0032DF42F9